MNTSLVDKYNVPGPRYTSYPTVPYWDADTFTLHSWEETLIKSYKESNHSEGISIYIHLPFCESLCTFCACHKRITKRHEVEAPYIDAVIKEWHLYLNLLHKEAPDQRPHLKELHLGGGTPTFFSPENLSKLIHAILDTVTIAEDPIFSFEGHPNNTTTAHLQALYDWGFRRVSFGVQDYDETIQKAIHRIQPFEQVATVTEWARQIGYTSISHDLVFGLPHHTWEKMEATIRKTLSLKPDRLAFYSYAHVPWVKGVGQRGFDESDLPNAPTKRLLYENGKALLEELGYVEIGMDHFSLPHDELYKAMEAGKVHRNFMGYTSSKTKLMIGLGMSAISDSWYGFAQNEKSLEAYMKLLAQDEIPVVKGHTLTTEDLVIRKHILEIMCQLTTQRNNAMSKAIWDNIVASLAPMVMDELIMINEDKITILPKGRAFTRNVAMAFDLRLKRAQPSTPLFSQTI